MENLNKSIRISEEWLVDFCTVIEKEVEELDNKTCSFEFHKTKLCKKFFKFASETIGLDVFAIDSWDILEDESLELKLGVSAKYCEMWISTAICKITFADCDPFSCDFFFTISKNVIYDLYINKHELLNI